MRRLQTVTMVSTIASFAEHELTGITGPSASLDEANKT